MLYLSDGTYGTFFEYLFMPGPKPNVLRSARVFCPQVSASELDSFTLWGPTCDQGDCIAKSVELPASLQIGDWLYFETMGGKSPKMRSNQALVLIKC